MWNRELLSVFKEASYWERLGFDLPRQCWEVYRRREDIRWLREELNMLTRNYNRAVTRKPMLSYLSEQHIHMEKKNVVWSFDDWMLFV